MGTDNFHHSHRTRRERDFRRKRATKEPKAILIVCEGQKTEKNYFESLKEELKATNIHICPSPKSNPSSVVKCAKREQKKGGYTTIFCIFDTDSHEDIDRAIQAAKSPLQAIVSKPCFEYWILLHFDYTTRCFGGQSPCDQLINERLKSHLPDYSKDYDFSKVIKYLDTAVNRAKQSKAEYKKNPGSAFSYTDVYMVIEAIRNTRGRLD